MINSRVQHNVQKKKKKKHSLLGIHCYINIIIIYKTKRNDMVPRLQCGVGHSSRYVHPGAIQCRIIIINHRIRKTNLSWLGLLYALYFIRTFFTL